MISCIWPIFAFFSPFVFLDIAQIMSLSKYLLCDSFYLYSSSSCSLVKSLLPSCVGGYKYLYTGNLSRQVRCACLDEVMSLYPSVHLFKCSSRMMVIPPRSILGCLVAFRRHWQSNTLWKWLIADQIVDFFQQLFWSLCVNVPGFKVAFCRPDCMIRWEDDRYMSNRG